VAILALLIPQGFCYTVVEHSICWGWSDEGLPEVTNEFLLTDVNVYLYIKITWVDVQEFESLWATIPDMMRGLSSAGSIEGSFLNMKRFRIVLKDPSGAEVSLPSPRKMYTVLCDPPGCISSGFWELLTITETTANGRWKVYWYEGDSLVFADEFVIGEEPAPQQEGGPSEPSFLERYGLLLVVGLAVAVAGIAVVAFLLTRRKGATVIPPPPGPPTPYMRAPSRS